MSSVIRIAGKFLEEIYFNDKYVRSQWQPPRNIDVDEKENIGEKLCIGTNASKENSTKNCAIFFVKSQCCCVPSMMPPVFM